MHITFIGHLFCNLSHVLKHFYIKPLAYFKCLNSFKKLLFSFTMFMLIPALHGAVPVYLTKLMYTDHVASLALLHLPYITVCTFPGAITFALITRFELRLRTFICWPLLPSAIAVPAILALTP